MGQVGRLGPEVGGHLALLLHSSREPGELSQCSKHDDSTINIVVVIIIIIIIDSVRFCALYIMVAVCDIVYILSSSMMVVFSTEHWV